MTDTTTTRRTPAERAQQALDICDRKIQRTLHRLDRAEAEVAAIEAERVRLLAQRDYLAANPDLPDQNDEEPTA